MNAAEVFDSHVVGKNIMTPTRIKCGFVGNKVYEITQGKGIVGEDIFGVTVIDRNTGLLDSEASSLVLSLEAAYEWVETLE